ncbi:MAG: ABC transporter permease [Planctomycetes bacterium]|nr:ABC transporter permease [Planctomycetota bacterium]
MASVSLRKVGRDLRLAGGRTVLLVAALVVSLVTIGAVLGARGILAREMPRSFARSHPASATLVLEHELDTETLAALRGRPELAEVERRSMVRARVRAESGVWLPLSIFVIEDFTAMRLQTVERVTGAWPPPAGAVVIERTSAELLGARPELEVLAPGGKRCSIRPAGTVTDPGMAPAWQEQSAYAYATPATLQALGITVELDLLLVSVRERATDAEHIERCARDVAAWLEARGTRVAELRVPPPGEHPQQRLMHALALVLLAFGGLALVLSALLVATVLTGMLARHARQIGAMKAIGASSERIALLYGGMVAFIGAASVLLALAPAVFAAQWLARLCADLSNVVLVSGAVPWESHALLAAAGLGAPLLAAAWPVANAARASVREAIGDSYGRSIAGGTAGSARAAAIATLVGPSLALALRNTLRRRGRLVLALLLFSAGGAAFLTGRNVAAASERELARGEVVPTHDVEITLERPEPEERVLELARFAPGVLHVEPFDVGTVAIAASGETPLARTHKDGGHGAQRLIGLPTDSSFLPPLIEGRFPRADEDDALVVAPGELGRLGTTLGGEVSLAIEHRTLSWRVVGIARGVGLGGHGGLYVGRSGFVRVRGGPGTTNGLRIAAESRDADAKRAAGRAIEAALADAGILVAGVVETERWNTVLRNHVALVQGALAWLGLALGAVGALVLASAMGTSVVERTREFGVMRALGATPERIVWIVATEAAFVGLASWVLALVFGLAGTWIVGQTIGAVVFGAPLGVVVTPLAPWAWLAVVLFASLSAAAMPAWAAARSSVREALGHV